MAGIHPTPSAGKLPAVEELTEQLGRVLHSSGFSNSEVLRSLLSYLVRNETEQPGRHVKEYEIATEVLGRGTDFDPRLDSTVRVHTGRLRNKLSEYYNGAGNQDPIRISIPRGAYHVSYELRPASGIKGTNPIPAPGPAPRLRPAWIVLTVLGWVAAVGMFGLWLRSQQATRTPPALVHRFWNEVTREGRSAVIVYSNPQFQGSATRGMRYATPGGTQPITEIHDRYTGIGEAQAIHELTRLFDQESMAMQVKRSQLLTWDEARDQNLIFLGGPDTNHPQRELPQLQQFTFKAVEEQPRPDLGAVVNLQPQTGEERFYYGSGAPYALDYAVIGFIPGLDGRHSALILAGTTTYGTQGATEFLMNPESVNVLLGKLPGGHSTHIPFFEALVRVKVSGGVPVQPELVLVRPRT